MKSYDAMGKVCPWMSGIGTYSTSGSTSQQYYSGGTGGNVINLPGPPIISSHIIKAQCQGSMCMAWVGDREEGRCGMVRVTDAEAVRMVFNGQD